MNIGLSSNIGENMALKGFSQSWGLLYGLTIDYDPFHAYFHVDAHNKYLLLEVNWVSLWCDDPKKVTSSPDQGRMQTWLVTHLHSLTPQLPLNSAITITSFLHPCHKDPCGKQNANLATVSPPTSAHSSYSRLLIKYQSRCCCEGILQMKFKSYINSL